MKDCVICYAVVACLSLVAVSCTVKEDRHDCPVILTLDMSLYGAEQQDAVVSTASEGYLVKQYYYPGVSDSLMLFEMPKGNLFIYGTSSLQSCYMENLSVRCPAGSQCDRLYTYSRYLEATGEYATDQVVMHKQFATVEFDLTKILSPEDYTCKAVLRGNYSALDLIDGSPLYSTFETSCDCVDSTKYRVRVPRQGDDGLELEIGLSSSDTLIFPVGSMLRKSGYDWDAEDLDDARIEIMAVETGVTITIHDWETGFEKIVQI